MAVTDSGILGRDGLIRSRWWRDGSFGFRPYRWGQWQPVIPSLYWEAISPEQQIHDLFAYVASLVDYSNNQTEWLEALHATLDEIEANQPGLIDAATKAEIKRLVESGEFAEMIEQAIINLDKYIPATANPIYYGADPTGEQDSTKAIQDAIDANYGGAITLSLGTYKITEPLKIPFDMAKKVSIFGNGATIVAGAELRAFIMAGTDRTDETANFAGKSKIVIQDLELLANGVTVNYGVEVSHGFKDLSLVNVTIQRATHGVLIGSPLSWDTRTPNDVLISNCMFYGTGSEFFGYGVMAIGTDNKIIDSRIYGYRSSVLNEGGGLFMNNVHGLLRWRDQDETWNPWPVNSAEWNEYYNQTSFIETKNTMQIINCYGDSQLSFMKVVQTGDSGFPINIDSCMYYNSRSDAAVRVFDIDGTQLRMSITNCEFSLRSKADLPNVECSGLHLRRALDVRYSHLTMSGNDISSVQWLSETDLLKCAHKCQRIQNSGITKDAWYVVGCVPICSVGLAGANTFVANVAGSRFASILNASGGANGAAYAYGGDRQIHRAPSIAGLKFGLSTKRDPVTGMYSLYVCAMLPSETTAESLKNVAIFLTDVMMGQSDAISYFNNGGGRGVHPSAAMQLLSDVLGASEPDYILATE